MATQKEKDLYMKLGAIRQQQSDLRCERIKADGQGDNERYRVICSHLEALAIEADGIYNQLDQPAPKKEQTREYRRLEHLQGVLRTLMKDLATTRNEQEELGLSENVDQFYKLSQKIGVLEYHIQQIREQIKELRSQTMCAEAGVYRTDFQCPACGARDLQAVFEVKRNDPEPDQRSQVVMVGWCSCGCIYVFDANATPAIQPLYDVASSERYCDCELLNATKEWRDVYHNPIRRPAWLDEYEEDTIRFIFENLFDLDDPDHEIAFESFFDGTQATGRLLDGLKEAYRWFASWIVAGGLR